MVLKGWLRKKKFAKIGQISFTGHPRLGTLLPRAPTYFPGGGECALFAHCCHLCCQLCCMFCPLLLSFCRCSHTTIKFRNVSGSLCSTSNVAHNWAIPGNSWSAMVKSFSVISPFMIFPPSLTMVKPFPDIAKEGQSSERYRFDVAVLCCEVSAQIADCFQPYESFKGLLF